MAASTPAATSLDTPDGIAAQLERRRHAVAEAWNLGDEVVLFGAGDRVPVNRLGEFRRLVVDLQCKAERPVQLDDLVRAQYPDR